MGKINISMNNKVFYTLIAMMVVILIGIGVIAYSGNVGHTSDQIDEADPIFSASNVADGVDWSELSGIPSGFSDGTDDVGSTANEWTSQSGSCYTVCFGHSDPGCNQWVSGYTGTLGCSGGYAITNMDQQFNGQSYFTWKITCCKLK